MDDIINFVQKLNSSISSGLRVCMPATIEYYDFKSQKARVKISMKELYNNGKELDYPVVNGVPVVFLSSGGASITLPVNRGDTCLLIFADRDMSAWLRGGVGGKPDSTRMHNLSDAIAIMGLQPFSKVGGAKNNEDLAINYAGSSVNITKTGEINIITTNTVNLKSVEDINIESKNVTIKATELLNADSKTATVKISDALSLDSKSATVKISEILTLESKTANITVAESTTIGSKNLIFNVAETITTNCKDAIITASNEIKTTGKFTHTGELIITGDVTTSGSITATGAIKSGSVTLGTHKHSYSEPVVGSTPTAAIPGFTGTPT
jgi:hypothetical protein